MWNQKTKGKREKDQAKNANVCIKISKNEIDHLGKGYKCTNSLTIDFNTTKDTITVAMKMSPNLNLLYPSESSSIRIRLFFFSSLDLKVMQYVCLGKAFKST